MENHSTISTRAGRYLIQPTGYKAFIPSPLPPDPPVQITGDLQALLSQADLALGRLDGSIQTLPYPDLFVFMYIRKEAVLSSQIEGTQSSLQDLLEAEAKIFAPHRPNDVDEVVNNEVTFVPPPPHEVHSAMSGLEQFLHTSTTLPQLVKIGLAHAQFETIHPFLDGNGRAGRLLITFLLCEQGVLQKPVLYLSHFFKQHRQRYYEELQSVRDAGAWEQWLAFFLRGIVEVSAQATNTARRILVLRENHRRAITENFGRAAGNGHRILEHLYEHPIVSVSDVQDLIGMTYPAANNLVARMVDAGILNEFTNQVRNRRFIYRSYIDLFKDVKSEADE